MKNISAWWPQTPRPGNTGDILTPTILTKLGYRVRLVPQSVNGKFLGIGSIAKFAKPKDTIWGTGIMRDSDPINTSAKYLAVRGPLTGAKVNCNVYGDAALLCSKLFPFKVGSQGMAVIPHYVDYHRFNTNEPQLNILSANPIEFIHKMSQYNAIISSSLHGIILAHAYGIPAGWWKPSDNLTGDGSKFEDYAQSVGVQLKPEQDSRKVKLVLPKTGVVEKIQENLLDVLQSR